MATYEAASYYERWLFTVETILDGEGRPRARASSTRGSSDDIRRRVTAVRVADRAHAGHHRTPGYLKGKAGHDRPRSRHVHEPRDTGVRRRRDPRLRLYLVEFAQTDVWPASASRDRVFADLFEHWLEPAS